MSKSFDYSPRVDVSASHRAGYLAFAQDVVRQAGAATLPFFRAESGVENKRTDGSYDPVTLADKAAEQVIRDHIGSKYPSHGIFGEEFGHETGDGLTWVIDPIDGTRAFVTGMVHWGVLLALFDGERPIVGAMYQPFTEELYSGDCEQAWLERGSEKRELRTSEVTDLSVAVMATTEPSLFSDRDAADYLALEDATRMCRLGGDCYIYGMVALGTLDFAMDATLNPYDIQALIPIVEGAGGVVTTFSGENPSMGGTVLASANQSLHDQALALFGS